MFAIHGFANSGVGGLGVAGAVAPLASTLGDPGVSSRSNSSRVVSFTRSQPLFTLALGAAEHDDATEDATEVSVASAKKSRLVVPLNSHGDGVHRPHPALQSELPEPPRREQGWSTSCPKA